MFDLDRLEQAVPVFGRGLEGVRRAVVVALALVAFGAGPGSAIDITLEFDPNDDLAVDPCAPPLPGCDHTGDLDIHVAVAAAFWEDVFEDNHEITIRYFWVNSNFPEALVNAVDGAGRPTEAEIRIPANFTWYYDPNPLLDDEFDMRPRLYRTTHPDEQAEAFDGVAPEVFEVGFNGLEQSNLPLDLLTTVLHEMGHTVGLAPNVWGAAPAACAETEADAFYDLDPIWVGGANVALKAFEFDDNGDTIFDCSHLALGGIQACKTDPNQSATSSDPSTLPGLTVAECTAHQSIFWPGAYPSSRQRPEIAGILVIATSADWQEIDLPRKYSLGSDFWGAGNGFWDEVNTWLGNRVPDSGDDVYLVNQDAPVTVKLFEPGAARSVTISDGNALELFFEKLDVGGPVVLDGPGTTLVADTGGELEATQLDIGGGSLLDVPFNGLVDVFKINNLGTIRGAGTIEVSSLVNDRLIRGNGTPALMITTANPNPALDLDGTSSTAQLQALVGDLFFDGTLTDPVAAAITVGGGRSITFNLGWVQQFSANPLHKLSLNNGSPFDAIVYGDTVIGGVVELDGSGRFDSNVQFQPFSRVQIDLGGLVPGLEHDQLKIDQGVQFAGELAVALEGGFAPSPLDAFEVVTYDAHMGEFDTVTGTDLGNGLLLIPEYGPNSLTLIVGFAGGESGAPNCNGKVVSEQAAIHGSVAQAAAFYGFDSVKAFLDAVKAFCG